MIPTPRQLAFLADPHREILFGGATGGGKSEALLMAALMYVDDPDYHAVYFRRTYPELEGSAILRAWQWLSDTDARYDSAQHTWTFPSGARLRFAHMEGDKDRFKHSSAQYHCCCYDELTTFTQVQYTYLFTRMRRTQRMLERGTPLRMLAASNPGGLGHEWVRQRFFVESGPRRTFIPSKLDDNPHVVREEYLENLRELDPITQRRYIEGDWDALPKGGWFDRAKARIVDIVPDGMTAVRWWDFAATEARPGADPDWTVGVKMARDSEGYVWVMDVQRFRAAPAEVENRIRQTAELDGPLVEQHVEQEPGAAGAIVADYYRRKVLAGFPVWAHRTTGDKKDRARPWAACWDGGLVRLARMAWINSFLDEHEAFPQEGVHDDQVDAASGAYSRIAVRMNVQEAYGKAYGMVTCLGCGKPFMPKPPSRPCPFCGHRQEAA